jgi:hypothetical protein
MIYRYGFGEDNWTRRQATARRRKVPLDANFIEEDLMLGEGGLHKVTEESIEKLTPAAACSKFKLAKD